MSNTSKPPRVWISNASPKKGEVLRVRAQIDHVMESGLRTDPATGKVRRYEGETCLTPAGKSSFVNTLHQQVAAPGQAAGLSS